jgi:methylmalonyl-CoA mutase cobalamin-binding subunit
MSMTNVVIGTISADAQMIGSWVITKALKEAGFAETFRSSGPSRGFVNAVVETNVRAILGSSMYGMGIVTTDLARPENPAVNSSTCRFQKLCGLGWLSLYWR